ncbi:MAG: PAS domain S-box protein [Candidatus Cloacimonetes bacterium]|nr:PAS domain S-box protein [Candidatus Cloacimonadota bacterium]MCF8396308.1 PAS domain S-box protein [Melioribacteraceae bacterium]
MIFTGIISNIFFIIILSYLYSFIYKKKDKISKNVHHLLNGILFGLIALAGMMVPLHFSPGVIFDGRSIILSIGAYFGGPIVAIISVLIAGSYRYLLGGAGAFVGIGVIFTSALIGLLYRYLFNQAKSKKIIPLYFFGLIVHFCMMLWMILLPGKTNTDVIKELTLPILLIYPVATLLIAKILIERESVIDDQAKLVSNEEKFKSVFESANVGKSITQISGEINVNKAFCDMLGYTQEELQNEKWQDLTPPEDVRSIEKLLAPLIKGAQDTTRFEKRYIHKNRTYVWADVSVAAMRDRSGKTLHFITTIVPIDERIKAQRELHALKEDLEVQIAEKTTELRERVAELERFHDATIEREIRMNELRDEIKRLKEEKNEPT